MPKPPTGHLTGVNTANPTDTDSVAKGLSRADRDAADPTKARTSEEFLQRVRDGGGQSSTEPLSYDFAEGWAIHPAGGGAKWSFPNRAHYWLRTPYTDEPITSNRFGAITYEVRTLCGRFDGIETTNIRLLGAGNVTRCGHCMKRLDPRIEGTEKT
jgi:hypothetical protein